MTDPNVLPDDVTNEEIGEAERFCDTTRVPRRYLPNIVSFFRELHGRTEAE